MDDKALEAAWTALLNVESTSWYVEITRNDLARAIAAYEAARETGWAETLCPECNRHVMEKPEPACGFVASCGRRLTRLSECHADGCAAPLHSQETRTATDGQEG